MHSKKFFIAFVAAFAFIFVFGFIWYAKLMHGVYSEYQRFGGLKQSMAAISGGSFLGIS